MTVALSHSLSTTYPSVVRSLHKLLIACVAISLAAGLTPFATAQKPAGTAERGEGAFAASCSFCHGSKATGTEQAPNLLRSPIVVQDHDGDTLGPFLKLGRPTLGMPAFASLPPEQVADIAAFLHARIQGIRGTKLPETAMLVGDPAAGRAYFNGAGKCSTCHSPTGDLAHIGVKNQPLALTTAFLTPPAQPMHVTVAPKSGTPVSGKLEYLDEFMVSLTDTSGVYHTWPRERTQSIAVVDPLSAHKAMLPVYTDSNIHDLLAYLVTLQ